MLSPIRTTTSSSNSNSNSNSSDITTKNILQQNVFCFGASITAGTSPPYDERELFTYGIYFQEKLQATLNRTTSTSTSTSTSTTNKNK